MGQHRRICTVVGCGKVVNGRGLCPRHYYLMKTYGSTEERPRRTLEDCFWPRVRMTSECWHWTGTLDREGYGRLGKRAKAHRFAYENVNGPIPPGLVIDHICHNRSCVRPEHLRAVTTKQNAENLRGAKSGTRSGVRGVSWNERRQCWQACVCHHQKKIHVGWFKELADAEDAVIQKRNEVFTHNEIDRVA